MEGERKMFIIIFCHKKRKNHSFMQNYNSGNDVDIAAEESIEMSKLFWVLTMIMDKVEFKNHR